MLTAAELRRRLIDHGPFAAIALFAAIASLALTHGLEPRVYFDSMVYLETADQPWSLSHFFYPKPPFVPLLYRAAGADPSAIAWIQWLLSLAGWTLLGTALVLACQRRTPKIAAAIVTTVFLLSPSRIGWTNVVLSESVGDSLQAMLIGLGALLLVSSRVAGEASRRDRVVTTVLVIVAVAWTWTRDTNAIVLLAAVVILLVTRKVRLRWKIAVAAGLAVNALLVLWTTTVVPPPTNLTVHEHMPEDFTARKTYSTFNNISDLLDDPEAVEFFVDRGLPMAAELKTLWGKDQLIYLDPRYAPARIWIAQEAGGAYVSWLLRHPIDRTIEAVSDLWTFLGVHKQHMYMPKGWSKGGVLTRWTRGLTENKIFVALMLLACPFAMWGTVRRHPLGVLAVVVIASGLLGCAASFYGDSIERARHCYGSGQQVLVGVALALLARLDLWRR